MVRCDNKDNLQDSAPCENCINTITNLNIKKIIYSSINNTFIRSIPEDLVPSHISAGNKFLIKNLQKTQTKTVREEKTKIKPKIQEKETKKTKKTKKI